MKRLSTLRFPCRRLQTFSNAVVSRLKLVGEKRIATLDNTYVLGGVSLVASLPSPVLVANDWAQVFLIPPKFLMMGNRRDQLSLLVK